MKIGVITFHFVRNYGAIWQTQALCKVLQELGHKPAVIDYRPEEKRKYYRNLYFHFPLGPLRMLKQVSFLNYVRKHLPLTAARWNKLSEFTKDSLVGFDALVCGSDQIWHHSKTIPLDFAYLLDLPTSSDVRKLSYAASCGPTTALPRELHIPFQKAVSNLDAVGVRDSNTERLVKELTGVQTSLVLDPTFLVDMSDFAQTQRWNSKRYIALFSPSAKAAKVAEKLSEKMNLPVVSLQHRWKFAASNVLFANPGKILGFLKDAQCVITSYFHGTALSIQLNRPFLTVADGQRHLKVGDMLERLGLMEHYVQDPDTWEVTESTHIRPPLETAADTINQWRERSRAFLVDSL